MTTERIYYKDVYCKDFTAAVLSCTPHPKKGYDVILSATAFFPEGGGQESDRGTLNGVPVTEVHERGDEVIHYTAAPLEVGAQVVGQLDWQHRFDMMQNHSGEHIFSGVVHRHTGANNVGFHMGKDTITVDFDVEISPEQLVQFELEANQVIWDNVPVDCFYPTPEALSALDYRSKKELTGAVRIVSIPGADICACCGTHVLRTGEVGLIRLISVQHFRGGSRIELLCGRRALAYVQRIEAQNHAVSVLLSAKPMQTAAAVERLKGDNAALSYRLTGLELAEFDRIAKECAGRGDVLRFEEGLSADSLRKLTVAIMETCGGRAAVFTGDDQQGYKYAIGQEGGDLRALVKTVNSQLHGRGGGKPNFVQGSVSATKEEILAVMRNS